jgi:hypothetical protein
VDCSLLSLVRTARRYPYPYLVVQYFDGAANDLFELSQIPTEQLTQPKGQAHEADSATKNLNTTARFTKLSQQQLADAVEKLAFGRPSRYWND